MQHLYGGITIKKNVFLFAVTLKRIDLTGNLISEIEDGAFSKLNLLEELSLAENKLVKLPSLPAKLTSFNANNNFLKTRGVKANAFKVHIIPSQFFQYVPTQTEGWGLGQLKAFFL